MKKWDYEIDMTLADMANEHTRQKREKAEREALEALEKARAAKARSGMSMLLCIPAAAWAFFHCDVFLRNTGTILEAASVFFCALFIVATIMERK